MKFNMKRMLLGVVMAAMAFTPLAAQNLEMNGFAGEDQTVLFPPDDPAEEKYIRLGTNDVQQNCVFHWEVISHPEDAVFSFSDANVQQPQFTFNKAVGDYMIEVTRVSSYGYQREYVLLEIKAEVELLLATSKKECWSPGDAVTEADFELVTNPRGYEDRIVVHPDDAVIGDDEWWYKDIRFRIHDPEGIMDQDCDETAQIFIANISRNEIFDKLEEAKELWNTMKDAKESFEKLKFYCKIIKRAKNKLDCLKGLQRVLNKISPPGAPFNDTIGFSIDTLEMDIKMQCCNDATAIFLNWNGGFNFYAGVKDINYPLWPGIPKLGLMLTGYFGAGAGVEVDYSIALPKYYECFEYHIPLNVFLEVGIGLKLMAFDDDLLKVEATFGAALHGDADLVVVPKPEYVFNGMYMDFSVDVEATFIGFNKQWHPYESEKYYILKGEND